MNDTTTITGKVPERVSDATRLENQWSDICWVKAQEFVNRLQVRIAKAAKAKKWSNVKRYQYLLTHSFYAKALAVRKVTTNKGKKTAGIDGEIWSTNAAKMDATNRLNFGRYIAKPVRRVYIQKKDKNKFRPLGIPCMYDRAMQALFAIVLDPISEVTADRNSFGFRKGRCAQDACAELFGVLSQKRGAKIILEGDIKGCFDSISHTWLMENIPMDKRILHQFLKAGYVYKGTLFPTEEGAAQGSIIGPILANMTLDGMQTVLEEHFRKTHRQANKHKMNFLRYADDFVVTASSEETAMEAMELIKNFLAMRGLVLSEEKTVITHINTGFDFLGWSFRKYKEKMIIKPSLKSLKSISIKISDLIHKGIAMKQGDIIVALNSVMRGWANYHQAVCAKSTFQKLGHYTFAQLWLWAKRRHPDKGKRWRKDRYWDSKDTRAWVFTCDGRALCNIAAIPIVRHPRLKATENPYFNPMYFSLRQTKIRNQKERARKAVALNRVCNA